MGKERIYFVSFKEGMMTEPYMFGRQRLSTQGALQLGCTDVLGNAVLFLARKAGDQHAQPERKCSSETTRTAGPRCR